NAIICEAESQTRWSHWDGELSDKATDLSHRELVTHDDALSMTRAARELAHDRNVAAIAVFTETGRTAQLVSKSRPQVPILAFTPVEATYNRLPLMWGVMPYLVPFRDTLEGMLAEVEKAIVTATPIQAGQQVVLISGFPVGSMRPPNIALLYTLGESLK
ncbi:MAG TPA: pyruvate kinase alpha/beta domain-containing protein, partial [Anaerolineales bacterium]|nr:pyruvate kinase alpha/beta domain-containing protein [Anaerolineales bacterium]